MLESRKQHERRGAVLPDRNCTVVVVVVGSSAGELEMSPELFLWLRTHEKAGVAFLAFDDSAQEVCIQVDDALYSVSYEQLMPTIGTDIEQLKVCLRTTGTLLEGLVPVQEMDSHATGQADQVKRLA